LIELVDRRIPVPTKIQNRHLAPRIECPTPTSDALSIDLCVYLGVRGPRSRQQMCGVSAYRRCMSQYMAWPTADGVWHIGTGLTLPPGAGLADLNKLLTLRHIDRAQIGFHRPNDEALFNTQFASAIDG
jgi:hypothetical protein